MALIYIFDITLSVDNFDAISPDHRGFYQRSNLAKMNELFDIKKQHFP